MVNEEEKLKNRFIELAKKAYSQNVYTYTNFLNSMELDTFYKISKEIDFISFKVFGGNDSCERVLIQFGSIDDFGYEDKLPISLIKMEPLIAKFADNLSHRDFLGALMNLGIAREKIGDIVIKNNIGYVYVIDSIAEYVENNLEKVKHTHVKSYIIDNSMESIAYKMEAKSILVPSLRIDAIVASNYKLSRSKSIELFREKKVYVNARLTENNSYCVKKDDVISVRGFGKFIYSDIEYETKKGRYCVIINNYI